MAISELSYLPMCLRSKFVFEYNGSLGGAPHNMVWVIEYDGTTNSHQPSHKSLHVLSLLWFVCRTCTVANECSEYFWPVTTLVLFGSLPEFFLYLVQRLSQFANTHEGVQKRLFCFGAAAWSECVRPVENTFWIRVWQDRILQCWAAGRC